MRAPSSFSVGHPHLNARLPPEEKSRNNPNHICAEFWREEFCGISPQKGADPVRDQREILTNHRYCAPRDAYTNSAVLNSFRFNPIFHTDIISSIFQHYLLLTKINNDKILLHTLLSGGSCRNCQQGCVTALFCKRKKLYVLLRVE